METYRATSYNKLAVSRRYIACKTWTLAPHVVQYKLYEVNAQGWTIRESWIDLGAIPVATSGKAYAQRDIAFGMVEVNEKFEII